jgi:hypothetical protein
VDHRFLRHGYLDRLLPEEMLLYFFLVLVSDARGLSFYSTRSLSSHLKLSSSQLRVARATLVQEGLIAYQQPLYQVLSLPVPLADPKRQRTCPESGPTSLGVILSSLKKEVPHES